MSILIKALSFVILVALSCWGLTLSWSLLAVTTCVVGVAGFLVGVAAFREKVNFHWLDIVVGVTVVYFLWRVSCSPVWDLAKEDLLLMMLGLVTYWIFRFSKLTSTIVLALCVAAIINIIAFIAQKLGLDILVPLDLVSESAGASQSFGLFKDYGALGSAMAISGMVLLSYASWSISSSSFKRGGALVIALAALVVTFFSGSRSAAVSVAVSVALLIAVSWLRAGFFERNLAKRIKLLVVSLGGVVTTVVIVLTMATFVGRDSKLSASGVANEANVRSDYWGMAFEQSLTSPIVGTGARSYNYESLKYWEGSLSQIDLSPEFGHNEYIQTLGDYGWIGLILLLVVLVSHWCGALKVSCRPPVAERDWQQISGLVGLTAVMVHALTDFPQRLPFNMVLAAICLAWCVPRKEKGEEAPVGRIKDKGLALILVLISVGVVIFCGKEVWAAAPLLEAKQAREDGAWSPVGHADTLAAYELANQRAADFRRSQRIGQIYHLFYERGDEPAFGPAVKCYKESLSRHTYNPVPMLNLGKLYTGVGRYDDAEIYYDLAEPLVFARDAYFEYYLHRAELKIAQGESAYNDGKFEIAEQHLVEAVEMVMSGHSDFKPRLKLQRDCYVARVRMAVEVGAYDKAEILWLETKNQVKPWILNRKEAMVCGVLGGVYFNAAVSEWKKREPELAKTLFEKSQDFYKRDRVIRKGIEDVQRDENMDFVKESLEVLKKGGF